MKSYLQIILLSMLVAFTGVSAASQGNVLLKPFTLAKVHKNAKLDAVAPSVRKKLASAGYLLVGIYKPHTDTTVYIVTDKSLLKEASKTQYGGFGAAIRVSVTQVGNDVQVAHNNPSFLGIAYNMKTNLATTRNKLAGVLGYTKDYGGKGIPAKELAEYRYSAWLENFYGFMDLAEHKSHQAAIAKVEAGFKKNLKNIQKVYRIDIPGKNQSIFGVSLKADVKDVDMLNDQHVMKIIDNKEIKRSAHLPYEIMVDGKRVITMHPHYRIALNFPDMRMFGKNSFGKLMNLPFAYEEYFVQLAGGQWPRIEEVD